jgi:excinuclease ABC subunit C
LIDALSAVVQTLRLPGCSRQFPREIGKGRPCLNRHLGLCEGWCTGTPDADEYRKRIHEALTILDGRSSDVEKSLEAEMFKAADDLRFEDAVKLRDRLKALSTLTNRELPAPGASADTDAVGFYRGEAKSAFVVMCYGGGKRLGKEYEVLDAPLEDDGEAVSEILRQYYSQRGVCPKTVLLPVEIPDGDELSRLFREMFGHSVEFLTPQRGDKYSLVKLAKDNAYEETIRATTKQERENKTLDWLKEHLMLPETPVRIEAYDISHTGGEDVVGGMVVFKDAKPLKRGYRRFKIKTVEGNDDYHSMREVLERRFKHFIDGDEKFSPLPDLILLDGGGTLAAMGKALADSLDLSVPVFGMVKDDRHRTRALVDCEDNEIAISARPDIFSFIGRIQEETHRFAIEYHRLLRDKATSKSALDEIPGVGDARKDRLFKRFKSIAGIKSATIEELSEIVPKNVAEKISEHFKTNG